MAELVENIVKSAQALAKAGLSLTIFHKFEEVAGPTNTTLLCITTF